MDKEGLREVLFLQFAEEAFRAAGARVEKREGEIFAWLPERSPLPIGRGVVIATGLAGTGLSRIEREEWLPKLCNFASEIGTLAVGTVVSSPRVPDPAAEAVSSLEVERLHRQYEPFAAVVLKVKIDWLRPEGRAFVAVASCITCEGKLLSVEEILDLRMADDIPPPSLRLKPVRMKEAFREAVSVAFREAGKFVESVKVLSTERLKRATSGIEALYHEVIRKALEEGGDPEPLRRSMAERVDEERKRLSVEARAHISAAATLYIPLEVRQISVTTWASKKGSFVAVAVPFVAERARVPCALCGRASQEVIICSCGKAVCARCGNICPSCGHGRCRECSTACTVCGEGLCPVCFVKCEICGSTTCRDHSLICLLCERRVCPAHTGVCPTCGKRVCLECAKICVGCERALCPEHIKPCPICSSPTCGRAMCMSLCTFCEQRVCVDCIKECATCGRLICAQCSLTCSVHKRPLCPDHALRCHSCGRPLCQRSSSNCLKCGQPLCPECAVACSICQGVVCPAETVECSVCKRPTCGKEGCLKPCASCGFPLCPDCALKCQVCEEALCPNCAVKCAVCGGVRCEVHSFTCSICGRQVCAVHTTRCGLCGRLVCSKCVVGVCVECGSSLCSDCALMCEECKRPVCQEHKKECFLCGAIVCPEHAVYSSSVGVTLCPKCSSRPRRPRPPDPEDPLEAGAVAAARLVLPPAARSLVKRTGVVRGRKAVLVLLSGPGATYKVLVSRPDLKPVAASVEGPMGRFLKPKIG